MRSLYTVAKVGASLAASAVVGIALAVALAIARVAFVAAAEAR